jgi:hypothetical protein
MRVERDYAAEMRAIIESETAEGPYTAAAVAHHIVDKLIATDPELLQGWLDAQAVYIVRLAIVERDRVNRSVARSNSSSKRSIFQNAVVAAELGHTAPLGKWLSTVFVAREGVRLKLSEMRKDDLEYCAKMYNRKSNEMLMQEAFLLALAKSVGKGQVKDLYDEKKLSELWRSIRKSD